MDAPKEQVPAPVEGQEQPEGQRGGRTYGSGDRKPRGDKKGGKFGDRDRKSVV